MEREEAKRKVIKRKVIKRKAMDIKLIVNVLFAKI
jgi:hypothetical protein